MALFSNLCPGCGTENRMHEYDCDFEGTERWKIEKAYIDIVSTLLNLNADNHLDDDPPGVAYDVLRETVNANLSTDRYPDDGPRLASVDGPPDDASNDSGPTPADAPSGWTKLHGACLAALKRYGRVEEREELGGLYLLEPDEASVGVIPTFDPIKTVFEYGPINGCKDIAVFSMVSWCELKDLSWDGTCSFIAWWLTETGRWDSESWAETSIAELCEAKRHVYEDEMGWGDHPDVAKGEMERSGRSRKLDADAVSSRVDRSTFES